MKGPQNLAKVEGASSPVKRNENLRKDWAEMKGPQNLAKVEGASSPIKRNENLRKDWAE